MEKIFVDGMKFERPKEQAPDFVKGDISIKADSLTAFIEKYKNEKGWLNIALKKSKGGTLYLELDTYGREDEIAKATVAPTTQKEDTIEYPVDENSGEGKPEVPF